MLAAIGSIILIIVTWVPLIFTVVKVFPKIWRLLKFLFGIGGATAGWTFSRSAWWGALFVAFSFIGGFGFFMALYSDWGMRIYLNFLDFIFTPFAYVFEYFLTQFINQLPNLPAGTASMLCLFDFGSCFSLLAIGFGFEVYMRVFIYFLVRRGR